MVGTLTGHTVGITGHRRWEEQAEMLTRRGAQVVHGPVMHTTLLHDSDATVGATRAAVGSPVDVVVLSTGIGTRSWFAAAESVGLDGALRAAAGAATVVARGPKARSAGIGAGLDVAWQASDETNAEVVAHLARAGVAGRRVVVQRDGGEPVLADAIRALGAEVVDVPVYRWHAPESSAPAVRLIEAACAGRLDAVTFTCAYAVGNTFALAPDPDALRAALDGPVLAVAVGPVCAAALHRHGVERVVEPARARLGAMVKALVAALEARHRRLRHDGATLRWQGSALVDEASGEVTTLAPGEARVLDVLVARAPAVVPKASLVDEGADPHAAEAAVARLRAKLGRLGGAVRTVPRRGYVCSLTVEAAGPRGDDRPRVA
ncbi:MAG TPA: uroporphyrinogen-III synthase [Acidimicrobiales bacterium]|nr:uroporphyrinogen-III synthase [Acidimicrobiales bacterium]